MQYADIAVNMLRTCTVDPKDPAQADMAETLEAVLRSRADDPVFVAALAKEIADGFDRIVRRELCGE